MPPVLDPALGNPRARALRERLASGEWRDAQAFLDGLRVFELRDFFVSVLSDWPDRPAWLDSWCHSVPGSPVPWLIRGVHGVHWAWEARGSTTADKVEGGAWPVFVERLQGAESDLHKAAGLDVEDPGPWSWLITTARALQQDASLERERFEEARRRDPDNLAAHRHFLTALCWKWGGSHDAMFGFAREASAAAPEGSRLHTLVPEAHLERWLAYGMEGQAAAGGVYLRTPDVVAEVEAAWRRSLGSPRYASPLGVSDRNLFAFVFWQQLQPARARRELGATGELVTKGPWQYLGDPVAVFQEAQQETGVTPSRDPGVASKIQGYCDDAVAMTREQRGITLDFGEASLAQSDAILQKLAAELQGLGDEDRRKATVVIALYHGAHLEKSCGAGSAGSGWASFRAVKRSSACGSRTSITGPSSRRPGASPLRAPTTSSPSLRSGSTGSRSRASPRRPPRLPLPRPTRLPPQERRHPAASRTRWAHSPSRRCPTRAGRSSSSSTTRRRASAPWTSS